jgi:translocation and assembly module TamB
MPCGVIGRRVCHRCFAKVRRQNAQLRLIVAVKTGCYVDLVDEDAAPTPAKSHSGKRRILIAVLIAVAFGSTLAWLARKPIADSALRQSLANRGIKASYEVKSIGTKWQRLENVRLGDPHSPDLTAEWVEVRLNAGLRGISATAIRAGHVRLKGQLTEGRLTLGSLDKLLPKSEGNTPFALPDIDLDLNDARLRLETPFGVIGTRLDGTGNLASGFSGKLAAVGPALSVGDCGAERATAYVDLSVVARKIRISGPIRADALDCRGGIATRPAAIIEATVDEAFSRWRGTANLEANSFQRTPATFARISGRISFDGTTADLKGTADVSAQSGQYGANRFSRFSFDGGFATKNGLRADGIVTVKRLVTNVVFGKRLAAAARSTSGTPLGPLIAQLNLAMNSLSRGIDAVVDLSIADGNTKITHATATGVNGLMLRVLGGTGLRLGSNGFEANTRISLSGSGFPTVESTFERRSDGLTLGMANVAPLSASSSRLALDPIRFAAKPSGAMLFETAVTLDGPLGSGHVEKLQFPLFVNIASDGGVTINRSCTPVAFKSLTISGVAFQPAQLRLCPPDSGSMIAYMRNHLNGGATISAPRLLGRMGGTPLVLTASKAAFSFSDSNLSLQNVRAQLGPRIHLSTLDIGMLSGRIQGTTVRGRFANMSGRLSNVPLMIDKGAGGWSLVNGALVMRGGFTLSDEPVPARFNSMVSDDALLTLGSGKIAATATLRAPLKPISVVGLTLEHDLGTGTGSATLNVPELKFGKDLQPEELTRLTLGVIANVEGNVSGRGMIRWTQSGVSSSGRFATQKMNFAAAFGPVSGLKGEIVFSDLLALATPPGQTVTIESINPGTIVTDGIIEYHLLPSQRIVVERGFWPFAGGTLTLDPTILDMGQPSDRRLTFRVNGLDAAKFIQTLEFENLSASGTFDGVLPMIFDDAGGRIEDGHLVARSGGGTIAYVGDVSNAQMNIYGKLAFDALKSMRFQNLTIDLTGPLDGEIVSRVNFSGRNEAPLSPPKSFIARQFIGLPFKFNVTIKAPFRSLLNTARTFQDPTSLLQRTLPELPRKPVQTPESEPKR